MRKTLFIYFFLILVIKLQAQDIITYETQEITADSLLSEDRFAYSIDINNDYAFVSSPGDDENGAQAGAVYVFRYDSVQMWLQIDKLVSSDIQAGDFFGYDVATDGDYVFISSPVIDSYKGAVYVFKNNDGVWTEVQQLTASDAQNADYFGYSVDVQGDYAIIGAYGDDDIASDAGAAYIFRNISGTWTEVQKITAPNAEADDHFGIDVGIYGDYAIIGAPESEYDTVNSGSAYIFKNISGTWSFYQQIISSDADEGDHFGHAVSIFDDKLVVGANYKTDAATWIGAAYIFHNNSGSWEENIKIYPPFDNQDYMHFGSSLQIYGNRVIVGAYGNVSFTPYVAGSAFVFDYIDSSWFYTSKLISSNNDTDDVFGYAVSTSDKYILVGAQMSDIVAENAGALYYFDIVRTQILTQPVSVTAEIGDTVRFSLTAIGKNLKYQWKKNGVNLTDDSIINGSNTNQLIIDSVRSDDEGVYTCVVSGDFGTVTSNNASLTVHETTNDLIKSNIFIYPNPTNGIIKINLEGVAKLSRVSTIIITDITGKIIINYQLSITNSKIDISNQPTGIYFIKILTDSGIIVKKIVKK